MTAWDHLAHIREYRKRADCVAKIATAGSTHVGKGQLLNLRLRVRNEWVRSGGCMCVMRLGHGEAAVVEAWSESRT